MEHLPPSIRDELSASLESLEESTISVDESVASVQDSRGGESSAPANASPLAPQIMEVSEEEFVKVPGYLRGRATLARVNDAVVDINAGAATKAKLCGTKMSKLNDANQSKVWAWRDAERSTEELSGGRGFVFESDLRGGVIKAGASGRELLIILRHLGRLKEISTPTGEKALLFLK